MATAASVGDGARALRDAFGRHFRYLRLSVTDRCNFRCVYCLPNGCPEPGVAEPLSVDEIGRLVSAFAGLGFWKVRLTGGEPTLRRDIAGIVARVAATPGIRRVGLTTNGYRIASLAPVLQAAGLAALNVSVDSLDPERFRQVTGSEALDRVIEGVGAALAAGIPSVKVNVVLLRGVTDADLDAFLRWTRDLPIAVRFIELMETRDNVELFRRSRLPADEIRRELELRGWTRRERDEGDGPAVPYGHPDHLGEIGFISAYAPGFCESCNRLRVSAAGDLKLCLFGEGSVPLRPLLQRDADRDELMDLVERAVTAKPEAHRLDEGCCGTTANLAATGG